LWASFLKTLGTKQCRPIDEQQSFKKNKEKSNFIDDYVCQLVSALNCVKYFCLKRKKKLQEETSLVAVMSLNALNAKEILSNTQ
jgi:hypothetical protein